MPMISIRNSGRCLFTIRFFVRLAEINLITVNGQFFYGTKVKKFQKNLPTEPILIFRTVLSSVYSNPAAPPNR